MGRLTNVKSFPVFVCWNLIIIQAQQVGYKVSPMSKTPDKLWHLAG